MSSWEEDVVCDESVNAAPYVLCALDGPQPYREHLATCVTCQTEVAELQIVVDALPRTVTPAPAPEALRQRILATVRSEAQLLQAAGHQADQPPKPAGGWRSRRGSLLTGGLAVAASATAVIAIALNIGSSPRERVTPAQIAASVQGAHVFLRQIGARSELVVSGMPQAPQGKVYEVWLSRATGSPQPTGALFSVTSGGSGSVGVPASLHGVKEVMVTSEPLGGSSRPTGQPLIRVLLRA